MKKKTKVPVTKGKTVYIVSCNHYGASFLELCSTRDSADRLIATLCTKHDYLYPYDFSIKSKRVK